MATGKWGWRVSHTLNSKKYVPFENGQITSANLKNTGETVLHIYGFGIEFDWQRATKSWWSEKCDLILLQDTEDKLPVVRFSIPIDVEPGIHKYRVGLQTESLDGTPDAEWKKHGTVWGAKEYGLEVGTSPDREYLTSAN